MKENELRINNYVLTDRGVTILVGINPEKTDKFKPIPLSEEWFYYFDFEKFAEFKIYNKQGKLWHYSIQKDPNEKDGYIFFIDIEDVAAPPSVKIKYVHTLQNLYFAFEQTELEKNENTNNRRIPQIACWKV